MAAELRRRGWDVDVVYCASDAEPPGRTHGPAGERLHPLDARMVAGRLPFPLRSRHNRAVMQEIRAGSFDFVLIQSHLFVSNLMVARAVGRAHTVWLNHGCDHVATGHPVSDRMVAAYEHVLAGRLRRAVRAVGGVSDEAAGWLAHLHVPTAVGVGNAVAEVSPPRTGRREGPLRVIYVGRLQPAKGALEAVRLLDALPASVPVALTVCGSGPLEPQVRRAAQESPHPVEVTGAIAHEEVRRRLADADVFVCLSDSEGFPTTLLEAGAAGCAVLTYPVGGTRELLEEGGGWRVADLREAGTRLLELTERPALATENGELLRRTVVTRFTWAPVVDRLLRLAGVAG